MSQHCDILVAMTNRSIIDERAAYTKRAQDYTNLIRRFSALELKNVGNYRIVSEIGSGAFGKVYLGYHTLIRCKVCLKKGNRNTITPTSASNTTSQFSTSTNETGSTSFHVNTNSAPMANNDNLMREFYYLREFRQHPHITKLYEIIITEQSVYMVLEYYPSGDLFEHVTKYGRLSVNESMKIFTQLVGAVFYLHENGCCHRDLKLENVLLDKEMNVKLSDFGFTRELPFAQYGSKSLLSEYCGTGAYMAPEIVRRKPYSGIKIDIWALGVILYTMLTGEMPFDDSLSSQELEYEIIHNKPRFLENLYDLNLSLTSNFGESDNKIDDSIIRDLSYLLSLMLAKDSENRVSSLGDILKLSICKQFGGEAQLRIVSKLQSDQNRNPKSSWFDLSHTEKSLFKNLVNAGVDRDSLKRAIKEETLDSIYGVWSLLKDHREKHEKKKSKKKSKSMLRLSTSRSFIDTAKQAFNSSPVEPSNNFDDHHVQKKTYINPLETSISGQSFLDKLGGSGSTPYLVHDAESLKRVGSLRTIKNLLVGVTSSNDKNEDLEKINPITEMKDAKIPDPSLESMAKSTSSNSINTENTKNSLFHAKKLKSDRKPQNGRKSTAFSFLKVFKSKKYKDGGTSDAKRPDGNSPSYKSEKESINNSTPFDNKRSSITNRILSITNGSNNKSISLNSTTSSLHSKPSNVPKLVYSDMSGSYDNILCTPDQSKLKRSRPTRPGSVISSYSMQSETSNGSGYITGYSTDTNMLSTVNTLNANSSGTNLNLSTHQANNNSSTSNLYSQHIKTPPETKNEISDEQTNNLASPLNSNYTSRIKITRGISEWSANLSQAESPNSSFTGLSRTNSVDSLSRSSSTRSRNKTSKHSGQLNFSRRGRSPLNAKVNAKWTFNSDTMFKHKNSFRQKEKERENQIIEEVSSESEFDQVEDGKRNDEDTPNKVTSIDTTNSGNTNNGNKKLSKLKHNSSVALRALNITKRPGSVNYPQKRRSVKFPIMPVTEEDDQIDEDEADIEEDLDNEYDDDDDDDENTTIVSYSEGSINHTCKPSLRINTNALSNNNVSFQIGGMRSEAASPISTQSSLTDLNTKLSGLGIDAGGGANSTEEHRLRYSSYSPTPTAQIG